MAHPLENGRIAFIGCGKMGEALLAGWLSSADPLAQQLADRGFIVVVPTASHARCLEDRYGITVISAASQLPPDVSLVILAVKPQVLPSVLEKLTLSPAFTEGCPLVISIAAGISIASLEEALPRAVPVIRAMPNMPLQVGEGASVVAKGTRATDAHLAFANRLFALLGFSQVVQEDQIDVVCALSGSGPAYFAYLAECLVQAGQEAGLSPQLACALARQTLAGTGACLADPSLSLEELRVSVSSPGGTTLAALAAFEQAGFASAVASGVNAAIRRAKELSQC